MLEIAKCSVEGCPKDANTKGMCRPHYMRLRSTGSRAVLSELKTSRGPNCAHPDGCPRESSFGGYCNMHYTRLKRRGSLGPVESEKRHVSLHPELQKDVKFCIACKTIKDKSHFQRARRSKDGLQAACRLCVKIQNFTGKYGFDKSEVARFIAERTNCAICGDAEDLVIDHCHEANRLRDVLCRRCNTGIGHFLDSPDRLRSAADYLIAHGKKYKIQEK